MLFENTLVIRNSCLRFLTDVSEIQFFAQLIQALVCRGIRCDKSHELWFNVQRHFTRIGEEEAEGKVFQITEKISCAKLEKTFVRVSKPQADRYKLELALIVEGVITAPDNKLHVYTTLRPTEVERDLPYITSLVPFPDRPVQFLDDLTRSVVGPHFHEEALTSGGHNGSAVGDDHDNESGAGAEDDETSASDDCQTSEGNDDDGSKADVSGDSSCNTSSETGAGDTEEARIPRDGSRVDYPLQWLPHPHLGGRVRVVD
ncbi:Hypothetical predicted protein [Olea europaea subsp. europaea]|uniref:Uncharacterized protein n=1 Tax=Olea europaea subsp. europaea TaxID=158383 RepID=A0A8S0VI11_OLEEU|nr:Hypothetical predicted protein [Olea europaea subsp. europaea]